MNRTLLFGLLVFTLNGCLNPEQTYFAEIEKYNFVPFKTPMAGVGTGTLLRGTPDNLMMLAPPARCFPYQIGGLPTDLRWASDVTLPSTYRKVQLDFNAKLNSIIATGTPAINFNLNMTKVRKVEFEVREASIQMFDQIALRDFFRYGMTAECRDFVLQYPFVFEGLQVTNMSFTFLDVFGGRIGISTANIGDFASFDADVQWQIENGYKLIVTSPKFVGYRVVQLRPQDDGFIRYVSTKSKNGAFVWEEIGYDYFLTPWFEQLPNY